MQARIAQAFSALREARTALYDASEQELEAKQDLEKAEALLLLSDRIDGKNPETRKAQLQAATGLERACLEGSRKGKAEAQLTFDLAQLGVDEIKWIIRATNGKVE